MTPSPQPPRAPHAPNARSHDERDLPDPANPTQSRSDACSAAHEIAGRLLRLHSWHGDPAAELRRAAADLEGIADALTADTPWPFGGIDGG